MQDHIDEITALGAGALGVSVAAPYQAELLMRDRIGFDLLLDPDGEFKRALGVGRLRLSSYLHPKVLWRYLRWMGRSKPGRITAGPTEAPGVVILDRDGVIRYLYAGETLGDYPPMEEVLDELRAVTQD